jgi:hypothetical protein
LSGCTTSGPSNNVQHHRVCLFVCLLFGRSGSQSAYKNFSNLHSLEVITAHTNSYVSSLVVAKDHLLAVNVFLFPCPHPCWLVTATHLPNVLSWPSLYSLGTAEWIEITASNSSSIVLRLFVVGGGTCLLSSCWLALATSVGSIVPAYSHHVTI